ncbi:hypothetical protein BKA65DRAFT_552935 [Rhexocercosporidium sp. MPI-PUGE-AT-0058]|nr:hypothetical protein BKA65DRAFT_552935 [Rhexocercosporidium sp. MPI-PUGE-AT-0058]
MAQTAPLSDLRASAASFHPAAASSSAASINDSLKVTAQDFHPDSTTSNLSISTAGAPTAPAAMRQRGGQPRERLWGNYRASGFSREPQSNRDGYSTVQDQSEGGIRILARFSGAPSTSRNSTTPSYVQSEAYHCPVGQFSFSKASHQGIDNDNTPISSEHKPTSKPSMLEVAKRHVTCTDDACECQAVINDLHNRLELLEHELKIIKLAETQFLQQVRDAQSLVDRVAFLEGQLAITQAERMAEVVQLKKSERTEREKQVDEVEERKQLFTDAFAKQVKESLASAAQAGNQASSESSTPGKMKTHEKATAKAVDQESEEPSATSHMVEQAPFHLTNQEVDKQSDAAPPQLTPPSSPTDIKSEFPTGGGISF